MRWPQLPVGALPLIALLVLANCQSDSPTADSPSDGPADRSEIQLVDGKVTIGGLGISFRLPPSFEVVDDPSALFIARSSVPPAVLSIDRDDASIVNHQAESGESLRRADIEGLEAVVVNNAALEGLPPGIVARELLVANGDRSFSAIVSSTPTELPRLWDQFIESIRIQSV